MQLFVAVILAENLCLRLRLSSSSSDFDFLIFSAFRPPHSPICQNPARVPPAFFHPTFSTTIGAFLHSVPCFRFQETAVKLQTDYVNQWHRTWASLNTLPIDSFQKGSSKASDLSFLPPILLSLSILNLIQLNAAAYPTTERDFLSNAMPETNGPSIPTFH